MKRAGQNFYLLLPTAQLSRHIHRVTHKNCSSKLRRSLLLFKEGRNACLLPWIPLKCIEPQIPLDTKKKCLLANFCMGLQKLGTFEVGSRPATILILNFEEVALRRTKKKRQRSTFKGFERYCEAPFAPGSALQHHCILPPAASFALVSQNSPLLIPSRSWVGPWKKILVLLSFQWPKQNVAG